MKNELWMPVVGYEQNYMVSNYGRVSSIKRPHCKGGLLILSPTKLGYVRTSLSLNGKRDTFMVHRLVLEAFIGPCPDGLEAAHLNGNRSDNVLPNLVWTTRKENHSHKVAHGTQPFGEDNAQSKLTAEQVLEIRRLRGQVKGRELAARFCVSESNVSVIQLGKSWTHL